MSSPNSRVVTGPILAAARAAAQQNTRRPSNTQPPAGIFDDSDSDNDEREYSFSLSFPCSLTALTRSSALSQMGYRERTWSVRGPLGALALTSTFDDMPSGLVILLLSVNSQLTSFVLSRWRVRRCPFGRLPISPSPRSRGFDPESVVD